MKLTERLRERKITKMEGDPDRWELNIAEVSDPLCIEAADRIERLEAALRQVIKEWDDDHPPEFFQAIKKARAALEEDEC